ncbi:hypothetical protein [Psychroserpens sp. NJDZ02]|uniref:hypothetical protein n=1 Tax=Psychroserpens sp. NJDZ02 TaxID=2570561 RepID=UPI0010A7DA08|nr:hypothetical protein [Psychroserpens sp. NJDZ02]QCE43042.1 hypothetical protein E9099_16995 [Psychroserpens sp. NJDZ02]
MKKTGFTITFEDGESHTRYLTPVGIKDAYWLNSKGKQLQQVDRFTTEALFGESIKIQINTFNVKDGKKIDVKIKAQIGGNIIPDFEEIIHTIKVENNKAILKDFYIDPKWYDETVENYYYDTTPVNGFTPKAHQTLVNPDEAITFTFDVKFKDKEWSTSKSLPKQDTDYLKPVSYRRNYEELIGLININDVSQKDIKNNYENKFIINKNSKVIKVVEKFIKKISSQGIEAAEILHLIDEYAPKLWKISAKEVQKNNYDDRPLYWARNKMLTYLKRNPCYKGDFNLETSEVYKGTKLDTAINDFENKSRNYTGVDFSKAKAGNKKKILITGFDPFQLNPDPKFSTNMGPDSADTFNPSGIVALYLNKNKEFLNQDIYIQTCIFPVRYEDFDKKVVEKLISKHISKVDAIITTSLNGGNNWFDIEADAIEYRGGFHDNICIGGQDYIKYNYNTNRFVPNTSITHNLTTLPKKKIFGNNSSLKINGLNVKFDSTKLSSSTEGGGGNYLSNEIMFIATSIRGKSNKPVGHFHLANLRSINRVNEVINVTSEIIKKIIK